MNYNNKDLRILNITHADMDGCASYILLKQFYNKVIPVPVTYQSEKVIKEALLKYQGQYDIIICTDFYPAESITDIEQAAPYLVLDHHETVQQFHNGKTVIINTSMCGAMLTYKFISKMTDISSMYEFTNIVNDWDMFILADQKSRLFNNIYWEMGFKWFSRRFIHGNVELYPEEKEYIIEAGKEFKELYQNLDISDLCDKGVFFETDKFMNECVEMLKKDGYEWFVIRNKNSLSIRTTTVDLTKIFGILGYGGGHQFAGGIPLRFGQDIGKVLNELQNAYDAIYSND